MKTDFYLKDFSTYRPKVLLRAIALIFVALFTHGTVSAQSGASMAFDGVDDRIDVNIALVGSYTKEFWIKPTTAATGSPQNILSGSVTAVYINETGHLGGGNLVELLDPNPLTSGVWTHVAVTYDVNTLELKLYRNGTLVDTKTSAFHYGYEPVLQIGAYSNLYNFGGLIDEVRVWDVVRTAAEISTNLNCEISHTSPGLIAYYNFNQGIANGNNTAITELPNVADFCAPVDGILQNFAMVGTGSNFSADAPASFTGACVVEPEIRLVGLSDLCIDSGDMIPEAADGTDFGIIVQQSKTHTFTIRNNGTGTLTVSGFSSSNPTDFTVSGTTPMTIAPLSSATFTVTFNPTFSYGSKSSVITILNDDADESVYTFTVQGVNAARGESLNFDGAFCLVQTPITFSGSYTKEAWIKPAAIGSIMNIFTGTTTALYLDAAGNLGGGNLTELTDPSGALTTGVWVHVAITYDDATGTLKLFKNGTLVDTKAGAAYGTETALQIGAFNSGYLFNGNIDEVRFWNVARTDAEITASYSCVIPDEAPGLVAYYSFNQGTAGMDNAGLTTLKDVTCNKQHATLVGFQLSGVISNWIVDASPATVSCEGVVSNIRVEGSTNCIFDGDNTPDVNDNTDFGLYSAPGIDHVFWIKNTGSAPLILSGPSISGTHASSFSIIDAPDLSVLPGDSTSMTVRFASTVNGLKYATINILSNDPNESPFTFDIVGEGMGPVPVSLLNFTGIMNGKVVNLKWTTTNELNNSGFEVLRSGNNQNEWSVIGFVPASGSNEGVYSLTDYAPLYGINTYRLKQIDVNGTFRYSNIVLVNNQSGASVVKTYPNPFKDRFTVVFNDESLLNSTVRLISVNGRVLEIFRLSSYNYQVNMEKYTPGIYMLQFSNGNVLRLIKK